MYFEISILAAKYKVNEEAQAIWQLDQIRVVVMERSGLIRKTLEIKFLEAGAEKQKLKMKVRGTSGMTDRFLI